MAPTLTALPLRVGGLPSALLAGGAHSAAVLSEHGRILHALELPVRFVRRHGQRFNGCHQTLKLPELQMTTPAQLDDC